MHRRRTTPAAACLLALGLPALAAGQSLHGSPPADMPEEGEDFCVRVFLRANGSTFGHEFAEFFFLPSVEDDPAGALSPELEGPVRADRAGFWWPVTADSLGAYMVGAEGTVWELRLARTPVVFRGTLRQAWPREGSPPVAAAYVMRTPCRGGGS